MTRYFFDVSTDDGVAYDYSGRLLRSPEEAHRFAELIAIDLGFSQPSAAGTKQVQARDVKGKQLFAVDVPPLDSIAA
jgi:hypothetical protein